jgi:hypothetical protein
MSMKVRVLLSVTAIALAAMWLTGCGHYVCGVTFGASSCAPSSGGIGSTGSGGTTIGAGNAAALMYFESGTTLDAAGVGGSTFASLANYTAPTITSGFADQMTIVNKQFVYLPSGSGGVQGYTILRSTGALTLIAGSPFVTSGTADGAWSDPLGRFLFVGSEGLGSITVFTINSTTGVLTEVAGSPFTATGFSSADILAVDASGKFLYAGQGFAAAGVFGWSINQTTGALTPLSGSPFNLQVAQIRTTPPGTPAEFLVGVQEIQDSGSGATDTNVYVYSINTTTGLPSVLSGGSVFATKAAAYDVTISPNGQFIYLPETIVGGALTNLEGFQMNTTTGVLNALSGSPFTTLPIVTQCLFDQSGVNLICSTSGVTTTALTASPNTGALTHAADFSGLPFAFAVTD